MTSKDDDNTLLAVLQRLLEQPYSPFHRKFDALTVDEGPVARCRECQANIRAREFDASKPFAWNSSTQRWQSELRQHLAMHTDVP